MVHITKGELTQEEKELLEVIGKGMGAGLQRGAACLVWGRGGALEAPLSGLTLRRGLARLVASHQEIAFPSVVWDRLRGRRGGEQEAVLGQEPRLQGFVSQTSFWKDTHIQAPAQVIMSDLGVWVPRCAFFKTLNVILITVSLGDGGLRFLEGCLKGPFDFRRPKDLDPIVVPAPAWGWRELKWRRVLYKDRELGL